MAKTFSIEFAGKTRPLRFTSKDGISLYKRFGRPLAKLLMEDCMGARFDERGQLVTGSDSKVVMGGDTNPEAQAVVIYAGLASTFPKLTEEKFLEQLDLHIASGGTMADWLWPAVKAAFYSGIVNGQSLDLEAAAEKKTDDEGGEGKDPLSETSTDPSSSTTT